MRLVSHVWPTCATELEYLDQEKNDKEWSSVYIDVYMYMYIGGHTHTHTQFMLNECSKERLLSVNSIIYDCRS